MSELSSRDAAERMGRGGDIVWESPFGLTMPAGYAMYARAHMATYGTTEEQMAKVRVKNSSYGSMNEKAVYRKVLTLDEIMKSEYVTSPFKKFDCCANADGASCIILAGRDIAAKLTDKPVWIMGTGSSYRQYIYERQKASNRPAQRSGCRKAGL